MTKVLLFDLGNVVLTNDHPFHTPEQLGQFCDYFGVTVDNLELAFSVAFHPYSLGETTEEGFWKKYLSTARAAKMDIEYAKIVWRRNQAENEHMLSLLATLRESYRIAALSTIPKEWFEFKRDKFKLGDYFDPIVTSGELGVRKPDPKVYEIALTRLDTAPDNV